MLKELSESLPLLIRELQ